MQPDYDESAVKLTIQRTPPHLLHHLTHHQPASSHLPSPNRLNKYIQSTPSFSLILVSNGVTGIQHRESAFLLLPFCCYLFLFHITRHGVGNWNNSDLQGVADPPSHLTSRSIRSNPRFGSRIWDLGACILISISISIIGYGLWIGVFV